MAKSRPMVSLTGRYRGQQDNLFPSFFADPVLSVALASNIDKVEAGGQAGNAQEACKLLRLIH